jgi:hypothetical protein
MESDDGKIITRKGTKSLIANLFYSFFLFFSIDIIIIIVSNSSPHSPANDTLLVVRTYATEVGNVVTNWTGKKIFLRCEKDGMKNLGRRKWASEIDLANASAIPIANANAHTKADEEAKGSAVMGDK